MGTPGNRSWMCGLRSTEPGDKIVTRPSGGRRGRRPERRASRLKGPRVERERRPSAGRDDLGNAVERLGTARAESARIPRRRCAVCSVCWILPLRVVLPWPRRLPRSARAPRQPCLLRLDGRRVSRSQATGAAPRPVLVTVSPRGARRDSKRPTEGHFVSSRAAPGHRVGRGDSGVGGGGNGPARMQSLVS